MIEPIELSFIVHISFVRSFVRLFNCSIVRLFVDHVCLILMFVRAFCKFSKTAFLIYILID